MSAISADTDEAWQQMQHARPKLSDEIKNYVQRYRDQDWYLLVDPLTNKQVLLDGVANNFIRQLNHGATIAQALEWMSAEQGQELDPDDVIYLLSQLRGAGMLRGDMKPTAQDAIEQSERLSKANQFRRLLTPFAIKIPLLDPDPLLSRCAFIPRLLFNADGGVAFLLLLLTAVIQAMNHWPMFEVHLASRFLDPTNLIWMLVLYPLVKGLHELGHGLTAKHWGAEIHEMGIMLLVFLPVPYVDATSTAAFHFKRHRMSVAAAGILTELALSSVALIAWCYADPGFGRDMLFNIVMIGGVSTLFFNGNPLLRFDGYYVLADALEIPNLGTRATAYLGYLFKSLLLGLDCQQPSTSRGEVAWLVLYGLSSGIYRFLLSLTIALYVAGRFFILGILLAIWFLLYQMLRPYLLAIIRTLPVAIQQRKLGRYLAVTGALTVLFPVALFVAPVPHSTVAYGIILPPESSIVRVQTSGFASNTVQESGAWVTQDEVVLELEDQELVYEKQGLEARLDELDARYRAALAANSGEAGSLKAELAILQEELDELHLDLASLSLRSQTSVVSPRWFPTMFRDGGWKKAKSLAS